MILFRQCDEATKTKIVLGATYAADRQAGRLIAFIGRLRTVCFGSDDGGLSYYQNKLCVVARGTRLVFLLGGPLHKLL